MRLLLAKGVVAVSALLVTGGLATHWAEPAPVAARIAAASRIVVLTGAGMSAESGVPTFRGADGLWKRHRAEELATREAFDRDARLVWDSGDELERRTSALPMVRFNASNEGDAFDDRSDNKGPEPEGVVLGMMGRKTFAFVGLERVGGVMVFDGCASGACRSAKIRFFGLIGSSEKARSTGPTSTPIPVVSSVQPRNVNDRRLPVASSISEPDTPESDIITTGKIIHDTLFARKSIFAVFIASKL